MELVYLWVENYKNIHHQGFNFSPRFECNFDGETLTIKENIDEQSKKQYIENFFENNINVTAIVGKNGSGKSNLLDRMINDIIFNNNIDYNEQPLYCYLNDSKDEIYINSDFIAEYDVKSNFQYKMTHVNSKENNFIEEYNKSFFYLYNNSLEMDNHARVGTYLYNEELLFYQEIDKSDNIINLDIEDKKIYGYLLALFLDENRLSKEIKELYIPTKIFLDREVFEYLNNEDNSYRDFLEKDIFDIDYILKLETLLYLKYFLNKHNKSFPYGMDNEDIEELIEILNSRNIVDNFDEILEEIEYYVKDILNSIKFIKKDNEDMEELIERLKSRNVIDNFDETLEKVEYYLKDVPNNIEFIKESLEYDENGLKNLIELEKTLNLLQNTSEISSLIQNVRNMDRDYEINTDLLDKENINKLKYLPSYLLINFINKKGIRFSELSSGEQNMLKLIFSIENIIHLREDKTDCFYILLDEIENSFHPNWQKKIFKWLTNFLASYDYLQFNIIITSHSPFIISDLPKQNIIFLDTYKKEDKEVKNREQEIGNCKVLSHNEVLSKKQTFGANIHTLLSDSFFMEDGLMGDFAKNKIRTIKVAHRYILHKHKRETLFTQSCKRCRRLLIKRLPKFWQIQEIIGEPFLQKIVKNQLEEIELILLGRDEAIDKEIARLQTLKASFKNA